MENGRCQAEVIELQGKTGKLISNPWQTPLVGEGDLDEAHPIISLVAPQTALGDELDRSDSCGSSGSLLYSDQEV